MFFAGRMEKQQVEFGLCIDVALQQDFGTVAIGIDEHFGTDTALLGLGIAFNVHGDVFALAVVVVGYHGGVVAGGGQVVGVKGGKYHDDGACRQEPRPRFTIPSFGGLLWVQMLFSDEDAFFRDGFADIGLFGIGIVEGELDRVAAAFGVFGDDGHLYGYGQDFARIQAHAAFR